MTKKLMRIQCAVEALASEPGCDPHFLTLTTRDKVSLKEIAARWRMFRNSRYFRKKNLRYIQVFEKHKKGHGWHIHCIINKYLNVHELRAVLESCGFGRFEIDHASGGLERLRDYLGKYVAKSLRFRDQADKGVRMTNLSRGLTRLKDIEVYDDEIEFCRAAVDTPVDCPSYSVFALMKAARHVFLTYPYCDWVFLRQTLSRGSDDPGYWIDQIVYLYRDWFRHRGLIFDDIF